MSGRNILSVTTEDFKKIQEALEDLESVRKIFFSYTHDQVSRREFFLINVNMRALQFRTLHSATIMIIISELISKYC
jgi:acetolactate synthase small subunit